MALGEQLSRFLRPIARRFPRAALAYRLVKESRLAFIVPKETSLGFRFFGNEVMEQGRFEPEETRLVKKYLQHADIFVNVGANIGYYCCIALKEGKHTIAFEPIETNLICLYKNIKANNWDDMLEVFPIALGKNIGLIEIYGGGTAASLIKGWAGTPEHKKKLVPISTLDTVLQGRLTGQRCFVLVDIEGAEDFMLDGATQFLNMIPKPVWMVEIMISEHLPQGVSINPYLLSTFSKFWQNGYEAWTADSQCRLVTEEEIRAIAENGAHSLATYNFLFIERGRKSDILGA